MPLRKVAPRKPGGRRFKGTEDPEHLKRVRAMRCLIAGKRTRVVRWLGAGFPKERVEVEVMHVCSGGVEAHHTTTKARGGHDRTAVPLCRDAHRELHRLGWKGFQERWNVALPIVASELARLSGADR